MKFVIFWAALIGKIIDMFESLKDDVRIYCSGRCASCGEDVGNDDSRSILNQLENKEKTCTWCGDDFPLSEDGDPQWGMFDLLKTAKLLNINSTSYFQEKNRIGTTRQTVNFKEGEPYDKVDISKLGLIDSCGNPRDRIQDAVSYEQIKKNDLPHKVLKFIDQNPNCVASTIYKRVHHRRSIKFQALIWLPISRLVASELVEYDSRFVGFMPLSEESNIAEIKKVPKFSRNYRTTQKGKDVLTAFDMNKNSILTAGFSKTASSARPARCKTN